MHARYNYIGSVSTVKNVHNYITAAMKCTSNRLVDESLSIQSKVVTEVHKQ